MRIRHVFSTRLLRVAKHCGQALLPSKKNGLFGGLLGAVKLFFDFLRFTVLYMRKHILFASHVFEGWKNILVSFFQAKRGRYNRPFLHIAAMVVLGVGVLAAPFLAETFPIFSQSGQIPQIASSQTQESIILASDVFQTEISQKPRAEILTYTIEGGDSLSTVAKKFGVSEDSIKWANDMSTDALTVGKELKIPPVTGVVHKVAQGESVYTIAKKYDTNPQGIVDFPFNEFANPQTFSLVEGQLLIVPNGVKPAEQPRYAPQRRYIATGPVEISPSGYTWPLQGVVSQFFAWYHPAIDILADIGTPIVASENGQVAEVITGGYNGGYGIHVIIRGASGNTTLYAHMQGVNVSPGDTVSGGRSVIGWVGMTGRTTGPHVHFEIRGAGGAQNPMAFLR